MSSNYTELKRMAERAALATPWYYMGDLLTETIDDSGDATYIAAASPDVVLSMIAEIDRLRTQNQALREALKEVVADRDGMCFDKEKHVESEYGAYWSPSASMVHSHAIAQAREAIAQAEGGV